MHLADALTLGQFDLCLSQQPDDLFRSELPVLHCLTSSFSFQGALHSLSHPGICLGGQVIARKRDFPIKSGVFELTKDTVRPKRR
jgi:hypothetical protein